MAYIYDSYGCDLKLNDRSGEEVTVIRELTDTEVDMDNIGLMYQVMFSDGLIADVYEDELFWCE